MMRTIIIQKKETFVHWWLAPSTRKDRVRGAIVGSLGSFWIGILGRIILGTLPISISTLGWWALGSVLTGIVLGITFPKVTTCICFPFSIFGVSS
jgi:hypothetical protein